MYIIKCCDLQIINVDKICTYYIKVFTFVHKQCSDNALVKAMNEFDNLTA